MTPTVTRPHRPLSLGRAPRRGWSRAESDRHSAELGKLAETKRIIVCCGCHMIGWYPAEASVDQVLGDLGRWADDPSYFPSLPWPVCCDLGWTWDAGEELAIWHNGQVLALVARNAAGMRVRRFDVAGDAAVI